MSKDANAHSSASSIQEMSIKIPSRLARRVEAYAQDNGTDIENVVIEALDVFLRERKNQ